MNKKTRNKNTRRPMTTVEVLEPRFMMSADLPGVELLVQEPQQDLNADAQDLLNSAQEYFDTQADVPSETDGTRHELIIIDPAVIDYQLLIDDIVGQSDDATRFSVLVLDPNEDGLAQITDVLSDQTGLDAFHIISHSSAGEVHIGNTTLGLESMQENADTISAWSSALDVSADILIYGCDLASTSEGELLVQTLADLTGADVAASDDTTGHENLGGDWDLEYQTGTIESDIVITQNTQLQWNGLLDVTTGLVGHWTLDSDGTDSSVNNLHGTLSGNASIDTNAGNLTLDGNDDYLDLGTHVASFENLNEGTIAGWIQTTDIVNTQTLFSISDQGDNFSYATFGVEQGNLFFSVGDKGYILDVDSTAFIADGNWHHIAVTVDTSGNSLYVDGIQVALTDLTYNVGDASSTSFFSNIGGIDSVQIGVTADSNNFIYDTNGSIDEVRVYDRALTATDIGELYTGNAAPVASDDSINVDEGGYCD